MSTPITKKPRIFSESKSRAYGRWITRKIRRAYKEICRLAVEDTSVEYKNHFKKMKWQAV